MEGTDESRSGVKCHRFCARPLYAGELASNAHIPIVIEVESGQTCTAANRQACCDAFHSHVQSLVAHCMWFWDRHNLPSILKMYLYVEIPSHLHSLRWPVLEQRLKQTLGWAAALYADP